MGRGTTAVAEKKDLTSFFATTRTANTLLSLSLSLLFISTKTSVSLRSRERERNGWRRDLWLLVITLEAMTWFLDRYCSIVRAYSSHLADSSRAVIFRSSKKRIPNNGSPIHNPKRSDLTFFRKQEKNCKHLNTIENNRNESKRIFRLTIVNRKPRDV